MQPATSQPHDAALARRRPREVLEDHIRLRLAGDLEQDLQRNYAEDVLLLTSNSCMRGHDALRISAARLREELSHARFDIEVLQVAGDHGLLIWGARADDEIVCCGADSFMVRGGLIQLQTVHYCLAEPGSGGQRHGDSR